MLSELVQASSHDKKPSVVGKKKLTIANDELKVA